MATCLNTTLNPLSPTRYNCLLLGVSIFEEEMWVVVFESNF